MFTRVYFQIVSSDEGLKHLFVNRIKPRPSLIAFFLTVLTKPHKQFLRILEIMRFTHFRAETKAVLPRKKQELHSKFSISSTTNDILMSPLQILAQNSYWKDSVSSFYLFLYVCNDSASYVEDSGIPFFAHKRFFLKVSKICKKSILKDISCTFSYNYYGVLKKIL